MKYVCGALAVLFVAGLVYGAVQKSEYEDTIREQDAVADSLEAQRDSAHARAERREREAIELSRRVDHARDTLEAERRRLVRLRESASAEEAALRDSLDALIDPSLSPLLAAMRQADAEEDSAYERQIATLEQDTALLASEVVEWKQTAALWQSAADSAAAHADTLEKQRDYWRREATSSLSISLPFGLELGPQVTCGGTASGRLDCAAGIGISF